MSFWNLSDNSDAAQTGSSYESPTGGQPIPNDSSVLAEIDEAGWDEKDGNSFVKLRWNVVAPEELAGRKVFHKLWVADLDPSVRDEKKQLAKRDKALKMLAAIDANAGGKLARKTTMPTDTDLAVCLMGNKRMVIKVMVYDMKNADGSSNVGNWIAAVNPKDHPTKVGTEEPPKRQQSSNSSGGGRSRYDDDDSVPF